eukprot:TRINITY_DN7381_c0_g1_i9.p1 TRINITY_DN7381_c0_g1~~TRINITY_DN7381_c0_g1_i9.p1  ORF type:complete len:110 (+),score=7.46 TRINITY_DN7381_c0_g1_i9:25-330(+)
MIRRPPRSTHCISSAASDVYKRQGLFIFIVLAHDHILAACKKVNTSNSYGSRNLSTFKLQIPKDDHLRYLKHFPPVLNSNLEIICLSWHCIRIFCPISRNL